MQAFLTPQSLRHVWPKTPKAFDAMYTNPHEAEIASSGDCVIVTYNEETQEQTGHSSILFTNNSYVQKERAFLPLGSISLPKQIQKLEQSNSRVFSGSRKYVVSLREQAELTEFFEFYLQKPSDDYLKQNGIFEWMVWPKSFDAARFISRMRLEFLVCRLLSLKNTLNPNLPIPYITIGTFRAGDIKIELPVVCVKEL